MSARSYTLGQRQVATDQTRARILDAARELLAAPEGIAAFSVDAVAKQAGVARATVYYQFESKAGLIEALVDLLAARGGMENMRQAFQETDPLEALGIYIQMLARFFDTDRLVTRRLNALAALDPEVGKVIESRNEFRRRGLQTLRKRLAPADASSKRLEEAEDMIYALLSFPALDALAGPDRAITEVVPLVQRFVLTTLGREASSRRKRA
jgi:AcrR family transcriptional regulator